MDGGRGVAAGWTGPGGCGGSSDDDPVFMEDFTLLTTDLNQIFGSFGPGRYSPRTIFIVLSLYSSRDKIPHLIVFCMIKTLPPNKN